MLILLNSRLRRPENVTEHDFYSIWLEEARAALAARSGGAMKGIWKVPLHYDVWILFDIPSAEEFERGILQFPVFSKGYRNIIESVEYRILTPYDDWVGHLEQLVANTKPGAT